MSDEEFFLPCRFDTIFVSKKTGGRACAIKVFSAWCKFSSVMMWRHSWRIESATNLPQGTNFFPKTILLAVLLCMRGELISEVELWLVSQSLKIEQELLSALVDI